MSRVANTNAENRLTDYLRRTNRLRMLAETFRAVCLAIAALLVFALLLIFVDAVLGFDSWGRVLIDVVGGVLGVYSLVFIIRQFAGNQFEPRRTARMVEERLGVTDSRFINAVDLANSPETSSPELVEQTVRDGVNHSASLPWTLTVDGLLVRRATAIAAGVFCLLVVSYFCAPRIFQFGIPRFLDPLGDHPPYTLVQFDTDVFPETVYQGKPASIITTLRGPDLPKQADIVFIDGSSEERFPMMLRSDDSYILPMDRVERSRRFYVDTPKGRSETVELPVLAVPVFESVDVSYTYPNYTEWPSTQHALGKRTIRGLIGTTVVLTVRSNLDLLMGRVAIVDAKSGEKVNVVLKPTATDARVVEGEFTLASSGRLTIELEAKNGATSLEAVEAKITAIADSAPNLAFIEPEPMVIAVENWKVPLLIQATDDVAVDRVVLFAGINGWGPSRIELELNRLQRNLVRAEYEFDMAALGAKAGDIITYYASAYDNHAPEPHFTDTDTQVIQIIGLEEYKQMARQEYQMNEMMKEFEKFQEGLEQLAQQREEMLKELDQLKEKLAAGEELSPEDQQRMEELEQKLHEFAKQSQELAKQMKARADSPELYEIDESYQETLKEIADQLEQQAVNARKAASQSQSMREQPSSEAEPKKFEDALDKFSEENEPFGESSKEQLKQVEQDMQAVDQLDKMMQQSDRIKNVIKEQRDLADRMAQFRNKKELAPDEEQRLQQMAKQQDLLRQELEEAAAELEKQAELAAEKLPKTAAEALGLCKAIKDLQIPQDQASAAENARDGQGESAVQSAEEAADKLESLLSKMCDCQKMSDEMSQDPGLGMSKEGMEKMLKQLAQGRKMPSLGGKPGSQGQEGGGSMGSKSRMTVMGPHMNTKGNSDEERRGGSRDGRGRGRANGAADFAIGSEALDPESRTGNTGGGGNMQGVPVGYKDQAEAYFRRVAEDE
jgi:hypothetical protein